MKKEYDLKKMKGYERSGKAKAAADATVPITIRMPLDIKQWLEAQGEKNGLGYQTEMLLVLRKAMVHQGIAAVLTEDRVRELIQLELSKKAG